MFKQIKELLKSELGKNGWRKYLTESFLQTSPDKSWTLFGGKFSSNWKIYRLYKNNTLFDTFFIQKRIRVKFVDNETLVYGYGTNQQRFSIFDKLKSSIGSFD